MRAALLLVLVFAAYTQAVPTCAMWCAALWNSTFQTTCNTTTPNFASEANCNSWCSISNFTVGFDGETANDTLGCRIYHAGVATGDATHCDHASMMGGGVCGTRCSSYCQNMMYGPCVGAYTDMATCMLACAAMPVTFGNGGGDINANDQPHWTNNVQCRDYHGGFPSVGTAGAAAHCPHAWITGGNACGDPCTGFCQNFLAACTGANREAGVTDQISCENKCKAVNRTGFATTVGADYGTIATGDTLGCRAYHSLAAFSAASVHCQHAWFDAPAGTPCAPNTTTTPTPSPPTPTPTPTPTSGFAGIVPVLTLLIAAIASKFF